MDAFVRLAPLLLLAAAGAFAQTPPPDSSKELPKDLHGRWAPSGAPARAAQPFDLENIKRNDDGTFAARLSWQSPDAKCTIRYQPITGRVTEKGLRFESNTPCKESWTAELARDGARWIGMASNKATPPAVVELTAK